MAEQSRRISGRIEENDPTLVALYDLIAPESDEERERRLDGILEKLMAVGHIKGTGTARAIDIRARLRRVFRILDREVPCEEVCFDPNDEKELDEAIEIFERLNKGGMSLKQGDVKAARLASEATASVLPRMREWFAAVTAKQQAAAQAVLDARAKYPTSTLADLYDPLMMPAPLLKAHQALDRAVDRCYRPDPFPSDRHRVEYLFALYEKITAPLVAAAKKKRRRKEQGSQ